MLNPVKPSVKISPLFLNCFQVDEEVSFKRHLNRLEVKIARREGQRQMKPVELSEQCKHRLCCDAKWFCLKLNHQVH